MGQRLRKAMTKQESINKFLVEVGEGGCWHEWVWRRIQIANPKNEHCHICQIKRNKINENPDFSQPSNFIRLLKIAEKKEMWVEVNISRVPIFQNVICKIMVETFGEDEEYSFQKHIEVEYSILYATLSELIAKALDWKEVE